ncbi:IS200/IS605 family element RNA-guided endonuclease TnpB, partial [Clostridioides difficile]|nr:transposase [Clostridioides difficile]
MIAVEKAYKFRMYPNKNDKETFTYKQCSSDLTNLKKELNWLKEPDKFSLQNALKDL